MTAGVLALGLAACSDDDTPSGVNNGLANTQTLEEVYEENGDLSRCTLDDFRAAKYTFDEAGYCIEASAYGMSADDFNNKVVGHLWKEENSWEILENGVPDPLSIWEEGIMGYGTQSYHFIDESTMKLLYYADHIPAKCYLLNSYNYDSEHRAVVKPATLPQFLDLDFHPLSVQENGDDNYLYTVRNVGIRSTSTGTKNVYYFTYFKMIPDSQIEEYEANYPTNGADR